MNYHQQPPLLSPLVTNFFKKIKKTLLLLMRTHMSFYEIHLAFILILTSSIISSSSRVVSLSFLSFFSLLQIF
ncbi:hypothetical protein ACMBCN_02900, partial [Candidatus Liberibacter asiaticus]